MKPWKKIFASQNLYTGGPFVFMMDSKVDKVKNEMTGLNLTSAVLCQKKSSHKMFLSCDYIR